MPPRIDNSDAARSMTKEELAAFKMLSDPVIWAENTLRNPDKPDEPLRLRTYQRRVLRSSSRKKVVRMGRRMGKTIALCVEILWYAFTHKDKAILIVCPYKSQVGVVFTAMNRLIGDSDVLKESIRTNKTNPYEIILRNGTSIRGFTAGTRSGQKGAQIRGQCLGKNTDVLLADGTSKGIDKIAVDDLVLAKTNDNRIVPRRVSNVFDTREKELFRVTLRSGRTLEVSKDHEIFGWDHGFKKRLKSPKWKTMSEWEEKEFFGIHLGYDNVTQMHPSDDDVSIAAYMIGDDSCGEKTVRNGAAKFTSINSNIIEDFTGILDRLGDSYRIEGKNTTDAKSIVISGLNSDTSRVRSILDTFNIYGKQSYQKVLPDVIKKASRDTQALFLRKLYSTDGWCCKAMTPTVAESDCQVEVGYCTTSKSLAYDIQSLLNSFGIVANIQNRDRRGNAYPNARPQYIVKIRSQFYVKRFLERIGYIFGKEAACQLVWKEVAHAIYPKDYRGVIGQIYLDRIESIESIGIQECYDIEVEDCHSFFANGVCVHNSADRIYLDEVDYMGDEAIVAITAIMLTNQETSLWASSTPTGKRESFYSWCTDKSLGFEEFHYASRKSPTWTAEMEYFLRNTSSEQAFLHEYEAEFGEEVVGVFLNVHVDACLRKYFYTDGNHYDEDGKRHTHEGIHTEYNPDNIYGVGVDWNSQGNGVHIVVVEYCIHAPPSMPSAKGRFRVFNRFEVSSKDFTQTKAVNMIKHINQVYDPAFIYVDEGYGAMQIESLRKEGAEHPHTGLADKVVPINFSSKIKVADPALRRKVDKPMKAFMVNNAVMYVEQQRILMPKDEDEKIKLVGQMRAYTVQRVSQMGVPVYSSGNDHILDGLMLALLGFTMEFSNLGSVKACHKISTHPSFLKNILTTSGVTERWGDDASAHSKPLAPQRTAKLTDIAMSHGYPSEYTTDKRPEELRPGWGDHHRSSNTTRKGFRAIRRTMTNASSMPRRAGTSFGRGTTGSRRRSF